MRIERVVAMLALPALVAGQDLAPGTRYDAKIPTLKQVVGHDTGEEITSPEDITLYLKALAQAAPDRTRLVEYARTWEGRPLHVLMMGSPERMGQLDAIRAGLKQLADPRAVSAADIESRIRELPVVVWLMHAVHGNEISSSDAALAEAYHLLAAQGDAVADLVRKEALVLIDPLENPDGRARFLFQHKLGRAADPDPEPVAAEHDEPWPGGRANHYLFDMNRDWFAQTQLETRGRTRIHQEWFPQVVVDLHEMGGNSTYYFAPPADPYNPHITRAQREWLEAFGRQNAARFDARGFPYFIREVYDSFYPGYGESWPIFHGAVGMTYEKASARGLVFRRDDETLLTYRDGVVQHFTAAISTAETAAKNRERLLRDFADYRRTAIQEGEQGPIREYHLLPGADPARAAELAYNLVRQGIDVRRLDEEAKVGSRVHPAGTFVVPLAQPAGRLARNLIDPAISQGDEFIREQDRRRKKRLPAQIYDITAWSLPFLSDVETVGVERPVTARSRALRLDDKPAEVTLEAAQVGYLIPWGVGGAAAVVEALATGLRIHVAERGFRLGGRDYAPGTAIARTSENPADLRERLAAIAARHRAEVVPLQSSWVDQGISLGSGQVRTLRAPRVILAWDSPTSSTSAGWARYVLERRYGQRVTIVRVSSLGRLDLDRYDVLVLPEGDYSTALNEQAVSRLKDWMQGGGTLITLGEATRWAAKEKVKLLQTRTLRRDGTIETEPTEDEKKAAPKPELPKKPFELEAAIQPEKEDPETTPGALLRVKLDTEHWLAAGTDGEVQVVVDSSRVLDPIKLDKGRNVGVYASKDQLVVSGLAWKEAQELLAQRAFLVDQPTGRGHLIAFAEDPNFRGFAEATELLFINAVLLGPGY